MLMDGPSLTYKEGVLYLTPINHRQAKNPASIRAVLLAVVDDLQLIDPAKLVEVQSILEGLFGADVAQSIAIDLGRKGDILVTTTKEIVPLVKLRSSQLATQLEGHGFGGQVRIVAVQKAP